MGRFGCRLAALALAALAALSPALAQSPPDADRLSAAARAAASAGRPGDAWRDVSEALRLRIGAGGAPNAALAADLLLLADLAEARGDPAGAERALARLLQIVPTLPAAAQPAARLGATRRLGRIYGDRQEFVRAESMLLGAIAAGSGADAVDDRLALARVYTRAFRLADAESQIEAAAAATAAVSPPDPVMLARVDAARGEWFFRQTRHRESATAWSAALERRETALGPRHPETAQSLAGRASARMSLGRLVEADADTRRALAIYEDAFGPEHPFAATLLANLGQVFYLQGRWSEAEAAIRRSLAIRERALGAGHASVAESANHLGYLLQRRGRAAEAEAPLERAIAIWSDPARAQPRYAANARVWLARARAQLGEADAALALVDAAVAALAAIYGPDGPAVADATLQRGHIRLARGDAAGAAADFARAAEIFALYGDDHFGAIESRAGLGAALRAGGDPRAALAASRRATAGLRQRIAAHPGERLRTLASELDRLRAAIAAHAGALAGLVAAGAPDSPALIAESFEIAQLARATSAGQALALAGARAAAADPRLARLVREREDLGEGRREIEERLTAAALRPAAERDRAAELRLRGAAEDMLRALADTDAAIAAEFPAWQELAAGRTVALGSAQALLGRDEALVAVVLAEREGFVWVVRHDAARFARIDLDADGAEVRVRELRAALSPQGIASLDAAPPFPARRAHELYRLLFGPVEDALAGATRWLWVPDAALQSLPLAVLPVAAVDADPATPAAHRDVPWLARRASDVTLPGVASLASLRGGRPAAVGREAYLGFGDPALADASPALAAFGELPETADELARVAAALHAGPDAVRLRRAATPKRVRASDLATPRVLHFATHGLMAGEFTGVDEPALVLTPEGDDGLLTASAVAALTVGADLVILSACNTAAADGTPGAEGLSGLARAFLYAGARGLLVSHWAVLSEAAVRIVAGMADAAAAAPDLPRDAAFRQAMLAVMDAPGQPAFAHPLVWAPFVLVGEGAAPLAR